MTTLCRFRSPARADPERLLLAPVRREFRDDASACHRAPGGPARGAAPRPRGGDRRPGSRPGGTLPGRRLERRRRARAAPPGGVPALEGDAGPSTRPGLRFRHRAEAQEDPRTDRASWTGPGRSAETGDRPARRRRHPLSGAQGPAARPTPVRAPAGEKRAGHRPAGFTANVSGRRAGTAGKRLAAGQAELPGDTGPQPLVRPVSA